MKLTQSLKNILWHLPVSAFYAAKYGFPSRHLTVIGVTGTDGKTTTANLLYHTLTRAGLKTGIISTIGAKIDGKDIPTSLHTTSPHPKIIHSLLKRMLAAGTTHVVLEVTSHALDQFRFFGIHFDVAVLTNISHEHLDYHHTIQEYMTSKARLFVNSDYSIFNYDDQSYEFYSQLNLKECISYGTSSGADLCATDIKSGEKLLGFTVDNTRYVTNSNYHHQIYNILAALAVIKKLKLDPKVLIKTIRHFPAIAGRRQVLRNKYRFKTIIDFAHTPAALKDTLQSLKKRTAGRLIVIFGATGGRDKTKRPMMGEIVSQIADIAFVTADDTRNEDVKEINRQIISGMDLSNPKFKYFDVPNRQDAFTQAVKMAQPGDCIIACGKGHETTILHGNTEYPWSEAEAFRTAFRLKSSA